MGAPLYLVRESALNIFCICFMLDWEVQFENAFAIQQRKGHIETDKEGAKKEK